MSFLKSTMNTMESRKYISGVMALIKRNASFPETEEETRDWIADRYATLTPEEREQLDEWNYAEVIAMQDAHNEENL